MGDPIRGFVSNRITDYEWIVKHLSDLPYAEESYTLGANEVLYLAGPDVAVNKWVADPGRPYAGRLSRFGRDEVTHNIESIGGNLAIASHEDVKSKASVKAGKFGFAMGRITYKVVEVGNAAGGNSNLAALIVSRITYEAISQLMTVGVGSKSWLLLRNPLRGNILPRPFHPKHKGGRIRF